MADRPRNVLADPACGAIGSPRGLPGRLDPWACWAACPRRRSRLAEALARRAAGSPPLPRVYVFMAWQRAAAAAMGPG